MGRTLRLSSDLMDLLTNLLIDLRRNVAPAPLSEEDRQTLVEGLDLALVDRDCLDDYLAHMEKLIQGKYRRDTFPSELLDRVAQNGVAALDDAQLIESATNPVIMLNIRSHLAPMFEMDFEEIPETPPAGFDHWEQLLSSALNSQSPNRISAENRFQELLQRVNHAAPPSPLPCALTQTPTSNVALLRQHDENGPPPNDGLPIQFQNINHTESGIRFELRVINEPIRTLELQLGGKVTLDTAVLCDATLQINQGTIEGKRIHRSMVFAMPDLPWMTGVIYLNYQRTMSNGTIQKFSATVDLSTKSVVFSRTLL